MATVKTVTLYVFAAKAQVQVIVTIVQMVNILLGIQFNAINVIKMINLLITIKNAWIAQLHVKNANLLMVNVHHVKQDITYMMMVNVIFAKMDTFRKEIIVKYVIQIAKNVKIKKIAFNAKLTDFLMEKNLSALNVNLMIKILLRII